MWFSLPRRSIQESCPGAYVAPDSLRPLPDPEAPSLLGRSEGANEKGCREDDCSAGCRSVGPRVPEARAAAKHNITLTHRDRENQRHGMGVCGGGLAGMKRHAISYLRGAEGWAGRAGTRASRAPLASPLSAFSARRAVWHASQAANAACRPRTARTASAGSSEPVQRLTALLWDAV